MDEKELLAQWIRERDELNALISGLQKRLGMTKIEEQGQSLDEGEIGKTGKSQAGKVGKLRPDEFFGMSQTEAAATYLKMVGHAVHIDEILRALQEGGLKLSGKNPKAILYTALVRGTRRFALVSPGVFGLVEFYPNRKTGGKKDEE